VQDEAEKHGDFVFSSVSLNHDFEATVAGLPEGVKESTLETLKRTTPEKGAHWVGTDGKVLVRLTAKDWKEAKALLEKYLAGKEQLGAGAAFKRVREQLPPEANMIVVAEIESAITGLVTSMRGAGDAIPGFPRLGPLKKSDGGPPAYIGFAVTLKGETATVTGYVPAAAIDNARKMLDSLFKKIE
jgi:hypothetical protein